MADEADNATAHDEQILGSKVGLIRKQANVAEAEGDGECLNCGEPVEPGKRWCNVECREDWQAIKNSRMRNVKVL